ncbi:MAG: hypothetical protein ACON42_08940 [Flavobacteriaceae bacterium]
MLARSIRRFFFGLSILIQSILWGQAPTWSVDESLFEYSMTFIARINIGGQTLTSASDIVGAFVGTECRGVANPTYISASDNYYVYLTLFSNTPGETMTFKVYKADTNEEITISRTVDFEANQHVGSRFQSYVVAEPPLRSGANLNSFGFSGIAADSLNIGSNVLQFYLPYDEDITGLTPTFEMSEGAKAFIRQTEQVSGVGVRDFSAAVTYQILSEDEFSLNEYRIEVQNSPPPSAGGGAGGGSGGAGSGSGEGEDTDEDSDNPVFTISESNRFTQVNEGGATDDFIIVVYQQPENQIVFSITSSDTSEVTVPTNELIFTRDNWNYAQYVQVQGVDDDLRDGDQQTVVTVAIDPSRSDAAFAEVEPIEILVTNLDDENTPGILVEETNGSTQVDETGSSDSVFIRLATEPQQGNVVLDIQVDDDTEIQTNVDRLRFTANDWYLPQQVTVTGVDDILTDGSQKSNIIIAVIDNESDDAFDPLEDIRIQVITTDDDEGQDNQNPGGDDDDDEPTEEPPAPPLFYKKDAVCYYGGAIKVSYEVEGTSVILNLNGNRLSTRQIDNGETIFDDIQQGSYVVEVAGRVKVVNIGLDE